MANQTQAGRGNCDGDTSKAAGTTFVQADSTCFRDLVQRLTGPSGKDGPSQVKSPPICIKPAQKLHERRKYTKAKLEIRKPDALFQFQSKIPSSPLVPGGVGSPIIVYGLSRRTHLVSPSSAPVSNSNKRLSPSPTELTPHEEEKAIKKKWFYLRPSPRSKQRISLEPELLTLFPLKSPTTNSATTN